MNQKCIPTIVHLSSESLPDLVGNPWSSTIETVRQFVQDRMELESISSEDSVKLFQTVIDSIQTKAAPDQATFEDLYELCNIPSDLTDQLIAALSYHFKRPPLINPIQDRNVCILLYVISKRYLDFFSKLDSTQEAFYYLEHVIRYSDLEENIFWALIGMEILAVRVTDKKSFSEIIDRLKETLVEMSLKCAHVIPYNLESPFGFQSAFVARYFLDNILPEITSSSTKEGSEPELRTIKLSPDKLSARIDDPHSITPVRSTFPISANSNSAFYYEVILLTSGSMQIGWCTKETEFGEGLDLGDDHSSIAFNGHYRCVYHQAIRHQIQADLPVWKSGDVVGCLIDPKNKSFAFYLNGIKVQFENKSRINFCSKNSYYACASLSPLQQCYFNFGQLAFQFPSVIASQNFHDGSFGDLRKYQLLEPGFAAIWYWFKLQPIDGHIELWFQHSERKDVERKFVEFFNKWENLFVNKRNPEHLGFEFCDLFKEDTDWLHFFEFLITKIGTEVIKNPKNNCIKSLMCDLKWFVCPTDDPGLPTVSKLLEFIYPYLQLFSTESSSQNENILVRNTCLVLSIIAERKDDDWETVTLILQEAKQFLKKILNNCNDSWTVFAKECLTIIEDD